VPGDPRMRASDADRDRVAALLQEHHAAGRLTTDEVRERLDRALEAKTLGDLDALMTDLPHIDLATASRRDAFGTGSTRLPAEPGHPGQQVAARDAAMRIAAVAVIAAGYLVAGVVFGIWWIPWYLVVFVAMAVIRGHRSR
jgi:hypothetical protein